MLLRRITQHVKAQNWFAVGIDFVIVVIGVYIGIQVSNWNERLAQKSQEAGILLGIAADVRRDREELRTGFGILLSGIGAGNYVLAKLGEPPVSTASFGQIPAGMPEALELDEDEKNRLWSSLVAAYFPAPGTTAYDALMSTGNLGIISDPELVDAIQNYYQLRRGMDGSHNYTMRPLRNEMLTLGQEFGLSPFRDVPEAEILEKVAAHDELRAAIDNQLGYKVLHYNEMSRIYDASTEILDRLDDEAGG